MTPVVQSEGTGEMRGFAGFSVVKQKDQALQDVVSARPSLKVIKKRREKGSENLFYEAITLSEQGTFWVDQGGEENASLPPSRTPLSIPLSPKPGVSKAAGVDLNKWIPVGDRWPYCPYASYSGETYMFILASEPGLILYDVNNASNFVLLRSAAVPTISHLAGFCNSNGSGDVLVKETTLSFSIAGDELIPATWWWWWLSSPSNLLPACANLFGRIEKHRLDS